MQTRSRKLRGTDFIGDVQNANQKSSQQVDQCCCTPTSACDESCVNRAAEHDCNSRTCSLLPGYCKNHHLPGREVANDNKSSSLNSILNSNSAEERTVATDGNLRSRKRQTDHAETSQMTKRQRMSFDNQASIGFPTSSSSLKHIRPQTINIPHIDKGKQVEGIEVFPRDMPRTLRSGTQKSVYSKSVGQISAQRAMEDEDGWQREDRDLARNMNSQSIDSSPLSTPPSSPRSSPNSPSKAVEEVNKSGILGYCPDIEPFMLDRMETQLVNRMKNLPVTSASASGRRSQVFQNPFILQRLPPSMPPPQMQDFSAPVKCHLCMKDEVFKTLNEWIQHVYRDLMPYTCTFRDCEIPITYSNRNSRILHEASAHRMKEWWICKREACLPMQRKWYHKHEFWKHLRRHNEFFNSTEISDFTDRCYYRNVEFKAEPCVFCRQVFRNLPDLDSHLSQHMEKIYLIEFEKAATPSAWGTVGLDGLLQEVLNLRPFYDHGTQYRALKVRGTSVFQRCKDGWVNGTNILIACGLTLTGRHTILTATSEREVFRGGLQKGTWVPPRRGLEISRMVGLEEELSPLFRSYLSDEDAATDNLPSNLEYRSVERKSNQQIDISYPLKRQNIDGGEAKDEDGCEGEQIEESNSEHPDDLNGDEIDVNQNMESGRYTYADVKQILRSAGRSYWEIPKNIYSKLAEMTIHLDDSIEYVRCSCNEDCLSNCPNIQMLHECDETNCSLEHCSNRRFSELEKRGNQLGVEIFDSGHCGEGLRSKLGISFPEGAIVIEYIGFFVTGVELNHEVEREYQDMDCSYVLKVHTESGRTHLYIDPTYIGSRMARSVNHSCNPNCRLVEWKVRGRTRLALFAIRYIEEEEELTFDYGAAEGDQWQECFCKSPNCRGKFPSFCKSKAAQKMAEAALTAECIDEGSESQLRSVEPGREETVLTVDPIPRVLQPFDTFEVILALSNMPPGITKLHFPTEAITQRELLSTTFEKSLDTLELHATLVCTSAMEDPKYRSRAFAYAATAPQSQDSCLISEDRTQICRSCIRREIRRRRGSLKLTNNIERIIHFHTGETNEWYQRPTHALSKLRTGGLALKVPSVAVCHARMQIACSCRHQNEKLGFQVIFTIKDCGNLLIAQGITSSIYIVDKSTPSSWAIQPSIIKDGSKEVFEKIIRDLWRHIDPDLIGPMALEQAYRYKRLKRMQALQKGPIAADAILASRAPVPSRLPRVELLPQDSFPGTFECQLCFRVARFNTLSQWLDHVFSDLQPYACFDKQCQFERFLSKKSLAHHDMEEHLKAEWWQCKQDRKGPRKKSCPKFYIPGHFKQHLLNHGYKGEQVEGFMETCRETRNFSLKNEQCRVCGVSGFEDLPAMYNHWAVHQEECSLTVLPYLKAGKRLWHICIPISQTKQINCEEEDREDDTLHPMLAFGSDADIEQSTCDGNKLYMREGNNEKDEPFMDDSGQAMVDYSKQRMDDDNDQGTIIELECQVHPTEKFFEKGVSTQDHRLPEPVVQELRELETALRVAPTTNTTPAPISSQTEMKQHADNRFASLSPETHHPESRGGNPHRKFVRSIRNANKKSFGTREDQVSQHDFGTIQSPIVVSDNSQDEIMSNSRAPYTNQGIIPLSRHIFPNRREGCYQFLQPGNRLNDEVIHALLLELKVGSCHVFDTIYPNSRSKKSVSEAAKEATLWVFPVHEPDTEHWSVVATNKKTRKTAYYNSLTRGSYSDFAKQLIVHEILCPQLEIDDRTLGWEEPACFQQKNGKDCGILLVRNVIYLMAIGIPAPPDFDVDVGAWRRVFAIVLGLDTMYSNKQKPNMTDASQVLECMQKDLQYFNHILSELQNQIDRQIPFEGSLALETDKIQDGLFAIENGNYLFRKLLCFRNSVNHAIALYQQDLVMQNPLSHDWSTYQLGEREISVSPPMADIGIQTDEYDPMITTLQVIKGGLYKNWMDDNKKLVKLQNRDLQERKELEAKIGEVSKAQNAHESFLEVYKWLNETTRKELIQVTEKLGAETEGELRSLKRRHEELIKALDDRQDDVQALRSRLDDLEDFLRAYAKKFEEVLTFITSPLPL